MTASAQLSVLDPTALADLRRLARQEENSEEALRAAAKQFEGLFLQMVLKAMRDATPQNGLFDSEQTRMFQQLHDQQLALELAQGRGVGLADTIFRQLGGGGGASAGSLPQVFDVASIPRFHAMPAARKLAAAAEATDADETVASGQTAVAAIERAVTGVARAGDKAVREARDVAEGARRFVRQVWDHAQAASRETGIPPEFMVAQAALETGWGRAVLRTSEGGSSHNLFNIKAGRNWSGKVVELPVTEYADGRAYTERARFRAYDSYADAFRDYAGLLSNNRRYAGVIGEQDAAAFARGLQEAGFATDPHYADKLTRIIRGNTLKVALSG
ncbi:MAG: flagellar assembly peptidoglycan hydrolase FlgJ [Rhodocyclaceae bacterium]